jgi:acyl homoserine lactone synthase
MSDRRVAAARARQRFTDPEAPFIWDVTSRDGHEYDRFDDPDSIYVLGTDCDEAPSGGWRLRPTHRGSMLGEVFTQLLGGAPAPNDPCVWEVSRFVINRSRRRSARREAKWKARAVLREAVRFAIDHDISRYVFVVNLAVERLIAQSGLIVHRFASPARIGSSISVACWIDIDAGARRLLLDESALSDATN